MGPCHCSRCLVPSRGCRDGGSTSQRRSLPAGARAARSCGARGLLEPCRRTSGAQKKAARPTRGGASDIRPLDDDCFCAVPAQKVGDCGPDDPAAADQYSHHNLLSCTLETATGRPDRCLVEIPRRPFGYSNADAQVLLTELTPEGTDLYLQVQHRLDLICPVLLAIATGWADQPLQRTERRRGENIDMPSPRMVLRLSRIDQGLARSNRKVVNSVECRGIA